MTQSVGPARGCRAAVRSVSAGPGTPGDCTEDARELSAGPAALRRLVHPDSRGGLQSGSRHPDRLPRVSGLPYFGEQHACDQTARRGWRDQRARGGDRPKGHAVRVLYRFVRTLDGLSREVATPIATGRAVSAGVHRTHYLQCVVATRTYSGGRPLTVGWPAMRPPIMQGCRGRAHVPVERSRPAVGGSQRPAARGQVDLPESLAATIIVA